MEGILEQKVGRVCSGNLSGGEKLRVPELLAPAGGYRAFLAALAAGADAIYVGIGSLNARVSAEGFTWETLAQATTLAHRRGVRVYAALNVCVFDDEFDEAASLVEQALACGVDAFIVADLGLIEFLNQRFKGIEIHVSTQTGIHAPEGLKLVKRELGVARATVARELPLPEIATLCQTGVPVEVFCHGAICISYSGACAFSALWRGRSAMRGDCTQPCRMSYDLVDDAGKSVCAVSGDHLLCPRDFLGIRHVRELCCAGVASLKIEGRMKNPDYVFNVVGAYRIALDAVAAGCEPDVAALEERLAHSFNRGFTDIYLRGARAGADLMSFERSINQGVRVGRVVARGHDELQVELSSPVGEGDTLEVRFYPGENTAKDAPQRWPMLVCPRDATTGETIVVHCKRRVEVGSEVFLTRDVALLEAARRAVAELDPTLEEPATRQKKGAGSQAKERVVESRGVSPVAEVPSRLLLDEMLRPNNRAETLEKIEAAVRSGEHVVCRNLSQIVLCRAAGARFWCANPIFCSNARTEALLKRWGAETVLYPDEITHTLEKAQLMVMEHCILSAEGPCAGACETCERRHLPRYLVQSGGDKLKIEVDRYGRSRIFRVS